MSGTLDTLAAGRPAGPGERLAAEMALAWRRGERLPAEHFLDLHPDLCGPPEVAVRLVYEEVCLRQEFGERVGIDELRGRFPAWAGELAMMLDCDRLVLEELAPRFPEVGETLGEFQLVAELGRGAQGRVFLARQTGLAYRQVVLKVTPRQGDEFRNLARLQHTHVIPLFGAYDFPTRNLRALCQPHLGGASLAHVLGKLRPISSAHRTGATLIDALDAVAAPLSPPARGGPRELLARLSYADAVCWLCACLADALHYAHQRGLLHLDVKPSNVLIAADGQPLLLDFHLARAPLPAGAVPELFGGTPGYASPEQQRAYEAACLGLPAPVGVDHRSDVFSLGRLLLEALGGVCPSALRAANPSVSVGLSDVIARCLQADPEERYPDAAALAADLRRHLAALPLRGVGNRCWRERWHKWRRRRPRALLWAALLPALMAVPLVLLGAAQERARDGRALAKFEEESRAARRADEDSPIRDHLSRGRALLDAGDRAEAARHFERAAELCPNDYWAHFHAGTCAYRRGRFAEAAHSFGVAVALAPTRPEAYHNRALALAGAGDVAAALRHLDRALELDPKFGAAALSRGVLKHQQGRHDEAAADLERALRDGADPASVRHNQALVRRAQRGK